MIKKTVIVIIIFLSLIGLLFIYRQKHPYKKSPTMSKIIRGEMLFRDEKVNVAVNSTFTTSLISNSNQADIVGFDIDLFYDGQYLKYANTENSNLDMFDLFTSSKEGQLIITGIKKVNYQKKIIFNNTQLVSIEFQTLKPGKTSLKLLRKNNSKNDSNIIIGNNTDILDKVNELSVNIGEITSLKKNQTITLNNNIKITLKDFSLAKQECMDCISGAQLTVEKNSEKKELVFKSGGIGGKKVNELPAFNYLFKIKEIKSSNVDFLIYEN